MNYVSPAFATLSYGSRDRIQTPPVLAIGFPVIPAVVVAVWVAVATVTAFAVGITMDVALSLNVLSIQSIVSTVSPPAE